MSSVYVSEPPTSGKVIFQTTHGPIEIQLWCKECPMTTRFFLQLCLDGYYDNMIFHRIVPSFLIQTGAMRQNEPLIDEAHADRQRDMMKTYRTAVRADYALERRKLELHSRLRFNHRGQVSMALPVDDDDDAEDLQPQFFVTLEESKNLDGKYVLFGTVTGPTYFNAARIGNLDVDPETNQPVDLEHAPRILSVKIVENPVHQDLVPQQTVPWRLPKVDDVKAKKKKRKGKFDKNVLSFGDEVEENDTPSISVKGGHDLDADKSQRVGSGGVAMDNAHSSIYDGGLVPPVQPEPPKQDDSAIETRDTISRDHQKESLRGPMSLQYTSSKHQRQAPRDEERVRDKAPAAVESKKESQSILEMRNAKYKTSKKSKKDREGDILAKLSAFQSKVKGQVTSKSSAEHKDNSLAARMARRAETQTKSNDTNATAYHGQVLESDDEDQGRKNKDWLQTTFKCRRHIDHSTGGDGRYMDDYEVMDPQLAGEARERDSGGHRRTHHRSGDAYRHD